MSYYIFCSVSILLFFLSIGYILLKDYKKLKKPLQRIVFCLFLAVVCRYNWGLTFCGLEYEDSFAFSFLAREFSNNIYTSSFLSEGIGLGSINKPELMQQYGGHFITYSTLLSYPIRLFGFSFSVIDIVTTILSMMSLLILAVVPPCGKKYYWMIAPSLFCIAPIINVFSNTFLCEPFSSLIIISFVYFFYKHKDNEVSFVFPLVAFLIAIMTKRDNLVLLYLPFLTCIYYCIIKKKARRNQLIEFGLFLLVVVLYSIFVQNVFLIESEESADIQSPTFSFFYFTKLFPVFMKSLLDIGFFSIVFYLFVLVVVIGIWTRKWHNFGIAIAGLWLLYLITYCSHYRGYFFVKENEASVFESFRYLNNFYCLIPISIVYLLKDIKLTVNPILCCLLVVASITTTISLRKELHDMEQNVRFEMPNKVVQIVSQTNNRQKATIIYSDILVLQNIVDEDMRICDIRNLKRINLQDRSYDYYLILNKNDLNYFRERYNEIIDLTDWEMYHKLGNEYNLYKNK